MLLRRYCSIDIELTQPSLLLHTIKKQLTYCLHTLAFFAEVKTSKYENYSNNDGAVFFERTFCSRRTHGKR